MAFFIKYECFTIGKVIPDTSTSWKASVPRLATDCWPQITTSGTESILAVNMPDTVFVAPGPDVTSTTPGLPVARA